MNARKARPQAPSAVGLALVVQGGVNHAVRNGLRDHALHRLLALEAELLGHVGQADAAVPPKTQGSRPSLCKGWTTALDD